MVGEADAERLRNNVRMHQDLGVISQVVTPSEIVQIEPAVDSAGVVLAACEPESGYADPLAATYAFAQAARQCGTKILLDTPILDVAVKSGRIEGVRTDKEFLSAPVVV